MVKDDLGNLMFYFAPDFQLHTLGGQVLNRAQTEQAMKQTLSGAGVGLPLDYTKVSTRIVSLSWRGKDAIVMAENTALAVAKKGGRAVRLETVSLARDYWTPTAQGWKVRQSVERAAKMWLDGKRVK